MNGTGGDIRPTHVRFPPRWLNTLVPLSPRSATVTGMSLYTACNRFPVLAQNALWALAVVGGARLLPGPRTAWAPPIQAEVLAELRRAWAATIGGPIDALAGYERLQASRAAFTVLLCAGRRSALVRVRRDPESFALERRISHAAERLGPRTFSVPRLVGSGEHAGWHWVAYEAISSRPHHPIRSLPDGLTDEVSELVESLVPRPAGAPPDCRGMHGDLNPWNLRRGGGRTWLIDWEDCGWGPPHADRVYFEAVSAAMRHGALRVPQRDRAQEAAAEHWRAIVAARDIASTEQRLKERLLAALAPGASPPGASPPGASPPGR